MCLAFHQQAADEVGGNHLGEVSEEGFVEGWGVGGDNCRSGVGGERRSPLGEDWPMRDLHKQAEALPDTLPGKEKSPHMYGYQGEISGNTYTTADGNPYVWNLTNNQIELSVQTSDGENFVSHFKFIWVGSYDIRDTKLSTNNAETTATIWEYRESFLRLEGGYSAGFAVRYASPVTGSIPSPGLNGQQGEVIYAYDTGGGSFSTSSIGSAPVTTNRDLAVRGHSWSNKIQEGWWNNVLGALGDQGNYQETAIQLSPKSFGKETADTITNYNPKTDQPIQIDLGSFDGAVGKLKIAKKSKKVPKLAKKDIDFIYDGQKGYLYYNENGKQDDFGKGGGIFAVLEGAPDLIASNLEFI